LYPRQPYFRAVKGPWHTAYLGIGSNMGNRQAMLNEAIWLTDQELGEVQRFSSMYETSAWGNTEQQAFLNQAIKIRTPFSPQWLMQKILQVEKQMGRKRMEKWGPRSIDIDILFYDQKIQHSQGLVIPHPQLHLRRFVLVPMVEIAPSLKHPILGKNMRQLLMECPDTGTVRRF
jgi:2-amino-4-hydroxy-6-hydroxymethyldihydropteridine diphosphokinase